MPTINVVDKATGTINIPLHITSDIQGATSISWMCDQQVNYSVSLDQKTLNFTPSKDGVYHFTITASDGKTSAIKTITVTVGAVTPTPAPTPTPTPTPSPTPTVGVIYDSHVNSKLHDGKVRTITTEGNIECRASGNPRIRVNEDGTFSLLCDAGHGRFYLYVNNYNSTMEIEAAFWNSVAGQDLSLRNRSRHNEGGSNDNKFGGYGFAIDRSGWSAKREIYHNVHDNASSGSLPFKVETGKYYKIEFTVKDDGNAARDVVKINGQQVMTKTSAMQPSPKSLFDTKSYFWVRSNVDSGTGEIRIKGLRILSV